MVSKQNMKSVTVYDPGTGKPVTDKALRVYISKGTVRNLWAKVDGSDVFWFFYPWAGQSPDLTLPRGDVALYGVRPYSGEYVVKRVPATGMLKTIKEAL